jgi:hypothetical protein
MRAKSLIVFLGSLMLALACAAEIWSAAVSLLSSPPIRKETLEISVLSQSEQWLGPSRGHDVAMITVAMINHQRSLVIGDLREAKWLQPAVHPERYRRAVEGEHSSVPVYSSYSIHPSVRYSAGLVAALVFLLVCLLICWRCLRGEQSRAGAEHDAQ